jgi:hypothetical protein
MVDVIGLKKQEHLHHQRAETNFRLMYDYIYIIYHVLDYNF